MKVSEKTIFYLERESRCPKGSDFREFVLAASLHDELVAALEQISKDKVNGKQSLAASVALGALSRVKTVMP